MRHRLGQPPDGELAGGIGQQRDGAERLVGGVRRGLGVEGARPQWPFERGPPRRRMLVIDVRRGAEKAVAADLALVGSGRKIRMGLARGFALDAREFNPVLGAHAALSLSTPRRTWSASMLSNRARKLPSPKPSLPLRLMISKTMGPMAFWVKICSSRP